MSSFRVTLCLLAPLAACDLGERALTGDCPDGEICSGDTPRGLHFHGASLGDAFLELGPHPTVAGGTQDLRLVYDPGTGALRDLDRPYLADDEGGRGVRVERTDGPVVTLRGVSSRKNHLRITDPDGALYDRKQLAGATLTEIRVVPVDLELIREGEGVVFGPGGAIDLTVALSGALEDGQVTRVVDEGMAISLPGATRLAWDTVRLPERSIGIHPMAVTAGDRPEVAIDVEVVAGADAIVAHEPGSLLALTGATMVCFSAHAAGRHVAGLAWTFETDNGTAAQTLIRNCAAVDPDRAGTLDLTVRAGGQVLVKQFTVVAGTARSAPRPQPSPSLETTAGERAAAQ